MFNKILMVLCLTLISGVFSRNLRIIGGEDSNIQEFPYLVSIRISDTNKHVCAGSIISHYDILTAAHCLHKKHKYYHSLRIYTGTTFLSDTSRPGLKMSRIYIHPKFQELLHDTSDSHNDIAIIKVKDYIEYNEFQNKVSLPYNDILDNTDLTILGWGSIIKEEKQYSDQLHKSTVKVIKYSECSKHFTFPILNDQICTYMSGTGTCRGDSGGPIIRNNKIVAIVSFSIRCYEDKPDIQVNVFSHMHFINSIIDKTNQE